MKYIIFYNNGNTHNYANSRMVGAFKKRNYHRH